MASTKSHPGEQRDEDWKLQEEKDNALLTGLLNESMESGGSGLFDMNRPLEFGEKADDAEDFEDISDDDLPDEDEPSGNSGGDLPGLTDDGGTSHDTDDLFGEDGRGSSPLAAHDADDADDVHIRADSGEQTTQEELSALDAIPDWREINFDPEPKAANQDLSIPAPAESADDLVRQLWPTFERGKILDWNDLLPPKKAHYNLKTPLKPPKPLQPTKISLDLAADQEKLFRTVGTATSTKVQRLQEAEARGLVPILEDSEGENSADDVDFSTPPPEENIGGVSWADLEVICGDWDSKIDAVVSDAESEQTNKRVLTQEDEEWLREFEPAPVKKQKVKHSSEFLTAPRFTAPSFDNFETSLSHLAKRPILDLNDPHLLIDFVDRAPAVKRARLGGNFKRGGTGSLSKSLSQRFNISNDEAYDALKENHQSKVRAVVGEFTVEHSFPAIKLQWPYYRVKLYTREARSYHRPSLKFNKFVNHPIYFSKSGFRKKKHLKGLSTQDIFKESRDLSLADNSSAMLLEYSEEYPTVLSNFGMGNRIINYYRRKDAEDSSRPKLDVGETSVLLPEDRSPFARFGTVDPGEIVPTLHNAMYRAPVFKHEPKGSDFLVIRSSTGIGGSSWHIRNIDHLYTVGQQFPLVEIPKPSSRKVTTAAKNRMKMIAFRKIRHHPDQTVRIGEITEHITDSTDMQNRQKLKEFIHYSKEEKVWRMKPGEIVPEETAVRTMVKPEDVCVIDAMQVGARHLEDAGYGKMEDDEEEQEEDAEGNDTQGLEQKLAPWKTSKNFIEASQGKAMLELHGDGDPSGCGMAFSLIKTSMKGGYLNAKQGPHATSADAIARERKANGGHLYNVDKQNALYNQAIKEIWAKQKDNLSSQNELPENDVEMEDIDEAYGVAPTPRSVAATPANFDDSVSQHSRISTSSRHEKVMRIVRQVRNKFGQVEEVSEIIRDHRVWREYQKRRAAIDAENINVYEAAPTGNAEFDKKEAARIKKELSRLEKNKERRHAREKQKGLIRASVDPDGGSPMPEKAAGTTRKCANCGQTGHIKTNKKLCPLLNGTMKPEDAPLDHDFGAISAPVLG